MGHTHVMVKAPTSTSQSSINTHDVPYNDEGLADLALFWAKHSLMLEDRTKLCETVRLHSISIE